MGFSALDRYKIVNGNVDIAKQVMTQLQITATTFWYRKDLNWAFPYVYCLVTNEIIRQAAAGTFQSQTRAFRWIANFYELYILNLNCYLSGGDAESPWMTAFKAPATLRPSDPWGARSVAAFIVGMFAHIKSDLPRVLAFIYLKFYSPNSGQPDPDIVGPPSPSAAYQDGKTDYDVMNEKVFPTVMNQMAMGSTQIIPEITTILPDPIRNGFLNFFADRSRLPRERADAWTVGQAYAADMRVQETVTQFQVTKTITPVRFP